MGLVVNNNIPALMSYNAVNSTSNALQKSIQKLSTGLRINSAADDAAGLAISEKMRAQVRGLDQAVRNSQDGISMIQTAEGALNETHSILQRMRELSVQSANDTLTQQDRSYIQLEIDQLREEVTRIGNTTQFNKKKLLDGSAAVLWSSDNLSTKAIVNGGLRQIDPFGQKSALEGNYNIDINAAAGQAEVQKTDIFKIKHKNVMMNIGLAQGVSNISIDNLPAGNYVVEHIPTFFPSIKISGQFGLNGSSYDMISLSGAAFNKNASILMEVLSRNSSTNTVTFRGTSSLLNADGTIDTQVADVTIGTAGIVGVQSALGVNNLGFHISAGAIKNFSAGAKLVFNLTMSATAGVSIQGTQNSFWGGRWGSAGNAVTYLGQNIDLGIDASVNGTVQFRSFYLNTANGEVYAGNIIVTYSANAGDADSYISSFTAAYIGQTAQGDVKLRDLDKFWDAQGRFLLTDPQTITITQGDGKQTSVTLYANDTLNDVASKLNNAISSGLGQGQYIRTGNAQFVTMVTDQPSPGNQQDFALQAVPGTLIIRSAVAGANGQISFAGDEDLIKAFSLNTIQDAKENTFTVSIVDAHNGLQVGQTTTITGNKLIGVINPNVDVVFDPMANIKVEWDTTTSSFRFSKDDTTYRTTLHLADNTTVFQIGANEGEDMGVNIGDMRSEALGLNAVLVTDRESAARSITVIDNAIDKVSMQRAKLGAYQNRLEHTINNLTVAGENLTAAESRIRDTDMAKEMMNFTKLNIMLQAGTSMLAQANQLPNNVLGLLR